MSTIDEYMAEVSRLSEALIDDGDLDTIREAFTHQEWTAWQINMRVLVRGKVQKSRDQAANELRELLRAGAFRAAQKAYSAEMAAAARQAAVARHYRLMECRA